MRLAFGIDLGGTQIKAAALTEDGALLFRRTAATGDGPGAGAPNFAPPVRALCNELAAAVDRKPDCIGLSAPGLADRAGRTIAFMPGRMHGLENFDWSKFLEHPVPVLNDGHAALLGEVWQGAARGLRDTILLTLGTGVGGAIWADGRLWRGQTGRAGHFGHLCLDPFARPTITGMPGGLENWIGNHNIAERTDGRFGTTHELVSAYERGEPFAREAWLRSVRALGCAVASLVNVFDPEAVIIGGGIASAGPALFGPLQQVLDETEWRPLGQSVMVRPAQLGEWAGATGAAWHALQSSA